MTLLWAADFTAKHDSNQADFRNVQRQVGGSPIVKSTTPIPGYTHPTLGYCLELYLAANEQRLEAAPKNASNLGEGDERYFRVDFVLGRDFPIEQTDTFCLINQILTARRPVHRLSSSTSTTPRCGSPGPSDRP